MEKSVYLLETETAFLAELYDVNAFDRTGVVPAESASCINSGRRKRSGRLKKAHTGKDLMKNVT